MDKADLVHKIYMKLAASGVIRNKQFEKGEIIANFINNREMVYFLTSGSANLIRLTSYGDELLLAKYERYDCINEGSWNVNLNNEMSIVATSKGSMFYFDSTSIESNEEFSIIYHYLYLFSQHYLKDTNSHLDILNKKTIREKLLAYFDSISKATLTRDFELNLSYTELAKYLGTDRAAMTREISLLEEENIIKRHKHHIWLNIT